MKFKDLNIGDTFSSFDLSYLKIQSLMGYVQHYGDEVFNAQCLDDHKLYSFKDDEIVFLNNDRAKFERLWESNTKPIDKALCHEFYERGRDSR